MPSAKRSPARLPASGFSVCAAWSAVPIFVIPWAPRVEAETHYYKVAHTKLVDLGLDPHLLSDTLIESLFEITKRYAHRVRPEALRPTVNWRSPSSS